jgi:hypothetical protein
VEAVLLKKLPIWIIHRLLNTGSVLTIEFGNS